MKHFTPQLYVEFNSNDAAIADWADAQWEQAISDYRSHLQQIRGKLHGDVRELAENICLHDATYLGYTKTPVPKSAGETAMVALQQNDKVVLLFYVLTDEPSLSQAHPGAVFRHDDVRWLYDELDVADNGVFTHEILFSNGRILSIRFVALDILTVEKSDFDKFSAGAVRVATGV